MTAKRARSRSDTTSSARTNVERKKSASKKTTFWPLKLSSSSEEKVFESDDLVSRLFVSRTCFPAC